MHNQCAVVQLRKSIPAPVSLTLVIVDLSTCIPLPPPHSPLPLSRSTLHSLFRLESPLCTLYSDWNPLTLRHLHGTPAWSALSYVKVWGSAGSRRNASAGTHSTIPACKEWLTCDTIFRARFRWPHLLYMEHMLYEQLRYLSNRRDMTSKLYRCFLPPWCFL